MNEMKITWHGHSCFTIEAKNYSIVLDPFEPGSVPGLPDLNLEANEVLCSHEHYDHNYRDSVTIIPKEESPFTITKIDTFHDDQEGKLRGNNIIHVLECDGLRLAHLGDLGHILSKEQVEAIGKVDCILLPIGGYYTIDPTVANKVAYQLQPKVVIPMHYHGKNFGFPQISTVEEFTVLKENVIHYPSNIFTITNDTTVQTAVLTCPVKE